jgi:hypothetical protein
VALNICQALPYSTANAGSANDATAAATADAADDATAADADGTAAVCGWSASEAPLPGWAQGLALVHFSAQLEPCLTQSNNLHTLHTP